MAQQPPTTLDLQVRLAAFRWLEQQAQIHGEVLPRTLLAEGFPFNGQQIPLVAPQGIFKPRSLDLPLTITTTPNSPYDDSFSEDGFLTYRYRGTDPQHRDNVGLRTVMARKLPLVYLHGILPGKYVAWWPVYIIGDNPQALTFKMAVDEPARLQDAAHEGWAIGEADGSRRAYLTSIVRTRLHQQSFRERVIAAYRSQCAFCRLRHLELLDAAHIIPDSEPEGRPTVDNGMALCKLHHTAYDRYFLGVTPDFQIIVRADILAESDGPILQHGLKEFHGARLILPGSKHDWPSREALAWKFERFEKAA